MEMAETETEDNLHCGGRQSNVTHKFNAETD